MSLYVSIGVSDGEEAHAWEHGHRHLRSGESHTGSLQRLRSPLEESMVKILGLTYYCLHMATSFFFFSAVVQFKTLYGLLRKRTKNQESITNKHDTGNVWHKPALLYSMCKSPLK